MEAAPAKPVKPAGKMKYIFKLAPVGKKVIAILGMVLALLAAGLLIFSYKTTMETPLWKFLSGLSPHPWPSRNMT